jgi:hypothetical protein
MVQNQNAPGTRSEHAGAKTNTIGTNDTTNAAFTSVPSKQKSTQKGSLLKSTQKGSLLKSTQKTLQRNKQYIER